MNYALAILAVTNIATLLLFAYHLHLESKEKSKTINALIAKNSQEFLNHEFSDKTEKIKVEPQTDIEEDLTALNALTDEEFANKIVNP